MPVQSEDCLYLNVYAPDTPEKDLPVMVWIHGGAFYLGAGSEPLYDGSALAAAGDVIVVTLTYRLGPFGFLHLSSIDKSYTNNLGLLDQIAALQWVKDNISAFGGNPENVTIFGESAGGMCIAALLTMPKAKGLFQKAIMESGASQTMPSEKAADIAAAFLETLDIEPDQSDILHSKTSEDILNAADKIRNTNNENIFSLLFQPTADPDTLPVEPEKAIAQGAAERIPLLIGTNKDEGYLFFTPDSEVMSQAEQSGVRTIWRTGVCEKSRWLISSIFGKPNSYDDRSALLASVYYLCISTIQHRTCLDVPIRLASRAAAA